MKPSLDISAAIRRIALLLTVGACVLGVGCGTAAIWKAEVGSPDGSWIASVETDQTGGFGTASILTSVYLKQNNRSAPPTQILGFSCQGPAPRPYVLDPANAGGTINLTLKWVTSSHLEVTYDDHPDLYFQVVKFQGIDISARDLSGETTKTSK
ncbi:MAG: hypothetical protein WCD49_14785 [Candidatus Acidiferrales bacterium]